MGGIAIQCHNNIIDLAYIEVSVLLGGNNTFMHTIIQLDYSNY